MGRFAVGHRRQVHGITTVSFPVHQRGYHRSSGAFAQQVQAPVIGKPGIEKVSAPVIIIPPFVEFVTFSDENAALLEDPERGQKDIARVGIN